jgi:tRNA-specific adenosine deaminase 1
VPVANGIILHDCHAEIIAIRAFNRFLLDECIYLIEHPESTSDIIEKNSWTVPLQPQFKLKCGVSIHMYTSEAPCGDASMELVMRAQEDATPWEKPPEDMPGRGDFSQLGVVRRQPGTFLVRKQIDS